MSSIAEGCRLLFFYEKWMNTSLDIFWWRVIHCIIPIESFFGSVFVLFFPPPGSQAQATSDSRSIRKTRHAIYHLKIGEGGGVDMVVGK